jgi:hypothetical protein
MMQLIDDPALRAQPGGAGRRMTGFIFTVDAGSLSDERRPHARMPDH